MHPKTYPIQIWFLDNDLQISAQCLTNKLLNKTINGCFQALCATYFYYYGIRSKKFYSYYFDKSRKALTMDRYFPCWPIKTQPKYQSYSTRQSKWCRKCKEHFEYIKTYMGILLEEYSYRTNKEHGLGKFLEWLEFDAPKINIPIGNLKKIVLDWKVLNPKYRKTNIVEGFKLQYKAYLRTKGLDMKDFTKRDIPEWLMLEDNKWLD